MGFDYNTYTGQIQLDQSGAQCLDVDTRGNYFKVIIGDCESSTYMASSFGLPSSSSELFEEVEGLLENAVDRSTHEWVLFSNEWDSNVLHVQTDEGEMCSFVKTVWVKGSNVVNKYKGMKTVSCDEHDDSFTFYTDHGKLIMQSKWGIDLCVTAWSTDDEVLPNYISIENCRDEVEPAASSRSAALSGQFSASWSQTFEYDQSSGHLQVASDFAAMDNICVSVNENGLFDLKDCEHAYSFGRTIDEL